MANFAKNLGKSIAYSSLSVLKELNPYITGTTMNASELVRDGREMAKNARFAIKDQKRLFERIPAIKSAKAMFDDTLEDLKSGNLSLEKESTDYSEDFDDIYDDYDYSTESDVEGDENYVSPEIDSTNRVGKAVIETTRAQLKNDINIGNMIAVSNVKSAKSSANQISNTLLYTTTMIQQSMLRMNHSLESINNNLIEMMKFQQDNVAVTNRSILDFLDKQNNIFEQMQQNATMPYNRKKNGYRWNFGSDFNSEDGFDFKEYMDFVKGNFDNSMLGSTIKMALSSAQMMQNMGKGNKGGIRPTKFVLESFLRWLLPQQYKKGMEYLNKSLQRGVDEMLYTMGDWTNLNNPHYSANLAMIGELFGKKRDGLRNRLYMSDYHKDEMPWNGIAQKALVTVIPETLSRIEQKIGNGDEKYVFDYNSGQFTTEKNIDRSFSERLSNIPKRNMYESKQAFDDSFRRATTGRKKLSDAKRDKYQNELSALFHDYTTGKTSRNTFRDKSIKVIEKFESDSSKVHQLITLWLDAADNSISDYNRLFKNIVDSETNADSIYQQLDLYSGKEVTNKAFSYAPGNLFSDNTNFEKLVDMLRKIGYVDSNGNVLQASKAVTDRFRRMDKTNATAQDDEKLMEYLRKQINEERSMASTSTRLLKYYDKFNLDRLPFSKAIKEKLENIGKPDEDEDDLTGKTLPHQIGNLFNALIYDTNMNDDEFIGKIYNVLRKKVRNARGIYDFSFFEDLEDEPGTIIRRPRSQEPDVIVNLPSTRELDNISSNIAKMDEDDIINQSDVDIEKSNRKVNNVVQDTLNRPAPKNVVQAVIDNNTALHALSLQTTNTLKNMTHTVGVIAEQIKNTNSGQNDSVDQIREAANTFADKVFNDEDAPLHDVKLAASDKLKEAKRSITGKGYTDSNGNMIEDITNPDESVAGRLGKMKDNALNQFWEYVDGEDYKSNKDGIYGRMQSFKDQILTASADVAAEIREKGSNAIVNTFGTAGENSDPSKNAGITKSILTFMNKKFSSTTEKGKKTAAAAKTGAIVGALGTAAVGAALGPFGMFGSMMIGGPIGGAIIGTATGILSQSETFKNLLFGKEGEDGKRIGGIVSKEHQESFKKILPVIVGGAGLGIGAKALFAAGSHIAGTGVLTSALLPGGVIGAAVLGTGAALMANSQSFKEILYGDEDRESLGKRVVAGWDKFKKNFPGFGEIAKRGLTGAGIGVLSSTLFPHIGIIGGALSAAGPVGLGLAGLGLGVATASEKFNHIMFGDEEYEEVEEIDENGVKHKVVRATGKRSTGIMGQVRNMIVVNAVDPIKEEFRMQAKKTAWWLKERIEIPLRLIFNPIKEAGEEIHKTLKEKIEEFGGGLMHIVKTMGGTMLNRFTKKWGKYGTAALKMGGGALRLGGEFLASPINILAGILAPNKRENQKIVKREALARGKEALQEKWEKNHSNFFERIGDRIALRAKNDDENSGSWMNYVDYDSPRGKIFSAYEDKRGYKKARKKDLRDEKAWIGLDNFRKSLAKDRGYKEMPMDGDEIESIRKKIMKKGGRMFNGKGVNIEEFLRTEDEINDFIYHKDKWRSHVEATIKERNEPKKPERGELQKNEKRDKNGNVILDKDGKPVIEESYFGETDLEMKNRLSSEKFYDESLDVAKDSRGILGDILDVLKNGPKKKSTTPDGKGNALVNTKSGTQEEGYVSAETNAGTQAENNNTNDNLVSFHSFKDSKNPKLKGQYRANTAKANDDISKIAPEEAEPMIKLTTGQMKPDTPISGDTIETVATADTNVVMYKRLGDVVDAINRGTEATTSVRAAVNEQTESDRQAEETAAKRAEDAAERAETHAREAKESDHAKALAWNPIDSDFKDETRNYDGEFKEEKEQPEEKKGIISSLLSNSKAWKVLGGVAVVGSIFQDEIKGILKTVGGFFTDTALPAIQKYAPTMIRGISNFVSDTLTMTIPQVAKTVADALPDIANKAVRFANKLINDGGETVDEQTAIFEKETYGKNYVEMDDGTFYQGSRSEYEIDPTTGKTSKTRSAMNSGLLRMGRQILLDPKWATKYGKTIGKTVGTVAGPLGRRVGGALGGGLGSAVKTGAEVVTGKTKFGAIFGKLLSWLDNLTNSKTLAKVFSKLPNGPKTFLKGVKETLTNAASKLTEKHMAKASARLMEAEAEATTKTASGAATAGTLTAIFTAYDAVSGAFEADRLFNVADDEVDWLMRAISSGLKALLGFGYGPVFDVAIDIFSDFLNCDLKCIIASTAYSFLMKLTGNEDKAIELEENQQQLALECELYNMENGTNLSVKAYSELKNPTVAESIWNGVKSLFGKNKKKDFTTYEDRAKALIQERKTSGTSSAVKSVSEYASTYNVDYSQAYVSRGMNKFNDDNYGYGTGPNSKVVGYGPAQADPRWAGFQLGKFANGKPSTMATSGCGPTALASIAGTDPLSVAKMAKNSGYIKDGGSTEDLMTSGAKKLGLNATTVNNNYYGALANGDPVILAGKGNRSINPFTQAGHIVSATGIDKNGNVLVSDPMTGKTTPYSRAAIDAGLTGAWAYGKKQKWFGNGKLKRIMGFGAENSGGNNDKYQIDPELIKGFESFVNEKTGNTHVRLDNGVVAVVDKYTGQTSISIGGQKFNIGIPGKDFLFTSLSQLPFNYKELMSTPDEMSNPTYKIFSSTQGGTGVIILNKAKHDEYMKLYEPGKEFSGTRMGLAKQLKEEGKIDTTDLFGNRYAAARAALIDAYRDPDLRTLSWMDLPKVVRDKGNKVNLDAYKDLGRDLDSVDNSSKFEILDWYRHLMYSYGLDFDGAGTQAKFLAALTRKYGRDYLNKIIDDINKEGHIYIPTLKDPMVEDGGLGKGVWNPTLLNSLTEKYSDHIMPGGKFFYSTTESDWAKLKWGTSTVAKEGDDIVALAMLLSSATGKAITPRYIIENILPRYKTAKQSYTSLGNFGSLFNNETAGIPGIQFLPEFTSVISSKDGIGDGNWQNYSEDQIDKLQAKYGSMTAKEFAKSLGGINNITPFLLASRVSNPTSEQNVNKIRNEAADYLMQVRPYSGSPFGGTDKPEDVTTSSFDNTIYGTLTGAKNNDGTPMGILMNPFATDKESGYITSDYAWLSQKLGKTGKNPVANSPIWKLTLQNGSLAMTQDEINDMNSYTSSSSSQKRSKSVTGALGVLGEILSKLVNIGSHKVNAIVTGTDYDRILDDQGNYLQYQDENGDWQYKYEQDQAFNDNGTTFTNINTIGSYTGDTNYSGTNKTLDQLINNPSSMEEQVIGRTLQLGGALEAGNNYAAVAGNDNGGASVGIMQWHTDRAKNLLLEVAKRLPNAADKQKATEFANKAVGKLSDSEASALSNFLQSPSVAPYNQQYQNELMISTGRQNIASGLKLYNEGYLKNPRSLIVAGDIENTGAHIRDWGENWKQKDLVNVNMNNEVDAVVNSLTSTDSWWGRQKNTKNSRYYEAWLNRIRRAGQWAKALPTGTYFGIGMGGDSSASTEKTSMTAQVNKQSSNISEMLQRLSNIGTAKINSAIKGTDYRAELNDLGSSLSNTSSSSGNLGNMLVGGSDDTNTDVKDWFTSKLGATVTSDYGYRIHPISGERKKHKGIDFGANGGTPIPTNVAGTVISNSYDEGGFGNYLIIQDSTGGDYHYFAHMQSRSPLAVGTHVEKGDIIGYVGTTGGSTGNHLHYEIRRGSTNRGSDIDPNTFRIPAAKIGGFDSKPSKVKRKPENVYHGEGDKKDNTQFEDKLTLAIKTDNIEEKMNLMISALQDIADNTRKSPEKPVQPVTFYGSGNTTNVNNKPVVVAGGSNKPTNHAKLSLRGIHDLIGK